jgi:hypothetical protein
VAQGLSKEGWNIVKTLFSQITLLTLGFFLGVVDSSIQVSWTCQCFDPDIVASMKSQGLI